MLTDIQIRKYIDEKKINITPFNDSQIRPSSYKVRLGNTLLIPKEDQLIDLKNTEVQPEYSKIEMDDNGYILKSGQFLLGQTYEKLAMDSDIMMFIDGQSTLARLGISIHQSSTTLLPGQEDHIVTLEIFNAGKFRVKIYPQLIIGKLIFFQSTERNHLSYKEYGKYAGQSETTGAKLMKNELI